MRVRRDANHFTIVKRYEENFVSVVDTSMVGFGFPDIVVGAAGQTDFVEIKTEDGSLLPSQVRFHRDWRGRRPLIVRTLDDVDAHAKDLRRRALDGSKIIASKETLE